MEFSLGALRGGLRGRLLEGGGGDLSLTRRGV